MDDINKETDHKDSEYKRKLKINGYKNIVNDFKTKFSDESMELFSSRLYSPDIIFQQNKTKCLIVEQSSTAVKKVHIAEFIQFCKLAELNKEITFEFLLILTQKKSNASKEYRENEIRRLKTFAPNKLPKNITGIYVLEDIGRKLIE